MATTHNILVTGGTGFLGTHLLHHLLTCFGRQPELKDTKLRLYYTFSVSQPLNPVLVEQDRLSGSVQTCFFGDAVEGIQTNIADRDKVNELFARVKPHIVIHCAAFCQTGECEKDPLRAHQINAEGTKNLIDAFRAAGDGLHFIHISTDWVFDGEGHFVVEDSPTPGFGVYGKSKSEGEHFVSMSGKPDFTILRLALMYGAASPYVGKNSFLGWMRDKLQAQQELKLFKDEFRTPVLVNDVVSVIEKIMLAALNVPNAPSTPNNNNNNNNGQLNLAPFAGQVFNLGGLDTLSRLEMGETMAEICGLSAQCLVPVSLFNEDGERVEKCRPRDLSMSTQKIQSAFPGYVPKSFRQGLQSIFCS